MSFTRAHWLLVSSLISIACGGTSDPDSDGGGPTEPIRNAFGLAEGGIASEGGRRDAGGASAGRLDGGIMSDADNAEDGEVSGCGSITLDAEVEVTEVPGNVLFLFDRSLSMLEPWEATTTRLDAARAAVSNAIMPNADLLTVGAIMFPTTAATFDLNTGQFGACGVDPIESSEQMSFRPGPQFLTDWQTYWDTHALVFSTPISPAFVRAREAIAGAGLSGSTVIVLVTDGEPACDFGPSASEVAAELAAQGVPTYVVGLPGARGVGFLEQVARRGDTGPGYLTPADAATLEAELRDIALSSITVGFDSCTIGITPPDGEDVDLEKLFLVVTEAQTSDRFAIPSVSSGGETQWILSEDSSVITLQGNVCEAALSGRYSSIRFEFGCVDIPVI